MGRSRINSPRAAMTLVELLVSILICGLVFGVIFLMLTNSLDIYNLAQEELFSEEILDKTTREITEGGFDSYGIKDALEIVRAGKDSIMFVPPWIDDSHRPKVGSEYVLNRPFRSGAPFPIGEIKTGGESYYRSALTTFRYGPDNSKENLDDTVMFDQPLTNADALRIVYWPDHRWFPDTAMNIEWHQEKHRFIRTYQGKTGEVPEYRGDFQIEEVKFEYFDNTNLEIIPDEKSGFIPEDKLSLITACRLTTAGGNERTRQCFSFVTIRNRRAFGTGLIIQKGTTFKIPDSHRIRTFLLANIVGVKAGDIVEIEARPTSGKSWGIRIEFDGGEAPLIRSCRVEYPVGNIVYSEILNQSADLGLNFLTLGRDGRYDYDYDPDTENVVELEADEVMLLVKRMDLGGAGLYIRP